MFKKPATNVKSWLLSNSDRRKLREELVKRFPELATYEIKQGEQNISILPDRINRANITTYNDLHGMLYIEEKNPTWFRFDKDKREILVPSVYTLWRFPNMLPKIPTFGPVISKLKGGANLMIPGIAFPPEGLPDVGEGEIVSVTIRGYTYPLAVGIMCVPTNTLKPGSVKKGIAVQIIHIHQDHLWSMGDKSQPPEDEEVIKIDSVTQDQELEEITDDTIEESSETSDLHAKTKTNVQAYDEEHGIEGSYEEESEIKNNEIEKPSSKYTTAEVDNLLQASFYQALLEKLTPPGTLPLTSSQLYSAYVLPSRPVGTDNDVEVKKSSYKKITKFLKAMEKKGVIKVKEQRGDTLLVGVKWDHEELKLFKKHKTIEKASTSAAKSQIQNDDISSDSNNMDQIKIIEVYMPKGAIGELFQMQEKRIDKVYEYKEISKIILDYVISHDLADKKNRRFVIPDEQLCKIFESKKGEPIPDKMTRNDLIYHVQSRMEEYHSITLPGDKYRLKKGRPKSIQLSEARRMGNKIVTIIKGLEEYEIDPKDLIEPLKKLCASSVAVLQSPNSSPKKPLSELMVQGPQTKQVKEYLVSSKGFPEKYIEIIKLKSKDKSGGKKG
ncbi:eukaryotic translation initiation factor SUI1 family protein [Gigaspora margarita]|uniref:Eukaryotic translation initiation factor SUI1 family protein n=1 Tax=Gigaspora margarita TaxID=4874 RepID=A0A8H4A056_GIGMA|nr:eukaryotic translation initiation factor SUI1 family protein [Gigaspora margarita]